MRGHMDLNPGPIVLQPIALSLSYWTGQMQWPKFPSVLNLVQSLSFLTLEYSISMHLHSTFHEICTIHECIHIVRTPKCREISEK